MSAKEDLVRAVALAWVDFKDAIAADADADAAYDALAAAKEALEDYDEGNI